MTPADVLREARKLIEEPGRWTQGAYARTASGRVIGPCEPNAACWCGFGAIIRCVGRPMDLTDAAGAYLNEAAGGHWADWQDAKGRRHATMLRRFDRAIALAERA